MSIETKKAILFEKNQVFDKDFKVNLVESCSIENGIVRLNTADELKFTNVFERNHSSTAFFIPASGSGSRMFAFLYKWLEDGVETKEITSFFQNIELFPFYNELKSTLKNKKELVKEVVEKFANLPKGLIPFHLYEHDSKTAFQEHVSQIKHYFGEETKIHFTIQKEFKSKIEENIGDRSMISYSFQNEETNAYCFDEKQEVVKNGDEYLRRPAGHGALLENLNNIDADIVVLKNIDNVQGFSKADSFKATTKQLLGVLISFKNELKRLEEDYSLEDLKKLNDKYPFLFPDDLEKFSEKDLKNITERPSRICGMVKNEGEPGGGPFWIKDGERMNNQIVEKAQIYFEKEQQSDIVKRSSHFNPVFIALSKTDVKGRQLDLMNYRDDSKFFVVEKTQKGKKVFYRELPGLWNGSMSNWNTIFVEIPSEVFTPVKSVLDLL